MPSPRMTTRRWMIAVAVVSLPLWGTQMRERHRELREIAARHALEERMNRYLLDTAPVDGNVAGVAEERLQMIRERWLRSANYYAAFARKYERAARRPWLPVPPDPSPPE